MKNPLKNPRGRPPTPAGDHMQAHTVTLDAATVETMRKLSKTATGTANLSGGIRIAAAMLSKPVKV